MDLGYKDEIAKNLKDGIAWIKILYEIHFQKSAFYGQWKYLQFKQSRGHDFDETKLLIEDEFSDRSRALYLRLKLKFGRTGD